MELSLEEKKQRLFAQLRSLGREGLLIAFSGGVDSVTLAAAAQSIGVSRLELATCHSLLHSAADLAAARKGAAELGLPLHELALELTQLPQVMQNSRERCYHCKKQIFSRLWQLAQERNLAALAEGANADDLLVIRPGLRAGDELAVARPLAQAGLTKAELRAMAREWGLSCHDKPSTPCLASRFPYDTALSEELLRRVEAGEMLLEGCGLRGFRLRCHGELARIECDPAQAPLLLAQSATICPALKKLGFRYITYDMEGFHSGSFDS